MKQTRKSEKTNPEPTKQPPPQKFGDAVDGEARSEMNMDWEGGAIRAEKTVAERAYELWLEDGCPVHRDLEHWLKAEQELNQPDMRGCT